MKKSTSEEYTYDYIKGNYSDDKYEFKASHVRDYQTTWTYAEKIFLSNEIMAINYEEYMNFFKAITNKYPIPNNPKNRKWNDFLTKLLCSVQYLNRNTKEKIFNDPYFHEYFERHSDLLSLEYFKSKPQIYEFLLNMPHFKEILKQKKLKDFYYSTYYCKNSFNIPDDVLQDSDVIKNLSDTIDFDLFHHVIEKLASKNNTTLLLEEHIRFCDALIDNIDIKNGSMHNRKYFLQSGLQELSIKKLVLHTIISRHFQTGPHNFLIDLKSFLDYVYDSEREVQYEFSNSEIYDILVNYQKHTLKDLIDLYNYLKERDIMGEFYDDWNLAKQEFVNELNSKIISRNNMPPRNEELSMKYGIDIYDITDEKYFILVHETLNSIYYPQAVDSIISNNGIYGRTCLSVQDQDHLIFYECGYIQPNDGKTIKLVFDNLDSRFLTFIYPDDAWSTNLNETDHFAETTRKIFPLRRLMKYTDVERYNELTYYTSTFLENDIIDAVSPLLPIAILCENEINYKEIEIAQDLGVPIIFRNTDLLRKKNENNKIKTKTLKVKPYIYFD